MTPDVLVVSFDVVRAVIPAALTTLILPKSAPWMTADTAEAMGFTPLTVGLVLGEWDAKAAARIEADTGWRVREWSHTHLAVLAPGGDTSWVPLPVGRLVATATVTNCERTQFIPGSQVFSEGWHWHLSDVALVDEPYEPPTGLPVVRAER